MDDDFNTPKVLGAFHELRSGINKLLLKGLSEQARKTIIDSLRKYGKPLGLFQLEVTQWNGIVVKPEPVVIKLEVPPVKVVGGTQDENAWIEQQINLRNEARAKKDFATADKIRQELDEKKITLEDRPDGTTRWKR
jgi:cysteinyl-tRNA synthetase